MPVDKTIKPVESDYDTGWREGYEAASGAAQDLRAENERLRAELRVTQETAKALIEGDQKLIDRLAGALEKIANTEGDVHPSWHVQSAREALGRDRCR